MKNPSLTLVVCILYTFASAQLPAKKDSDGFFQKNSNQRNSGTYNYVLTTFTDTYNDLTGAISINNGEVWDDPEYSFPVAFPFELNGHDVMSLSFVGVGSVSISPTEDAGFDVAVFPFEADLMDRGYIDDNSMSPISYKVEGTTGNRILKMEFKNAGSYYEMEENNTLNMFINFQLWLYESNHQVEFRFGPNSINDPEIFYGGESGGYMGIMDVNSEDEILINPHFLVGSTSNPSLSMEPLTINGTPENGRVYRLSLNLPLDIVVTGEDATSTCEPNGSATVVVTGGIEPYSYDWSNGQTTQTIINLDAGTYTVTVTDDAGDSETGSVTITNADPLFANAEATDETGVNANDGTATSTPSGGTPPYAYEWSNGENTASIVGLSPGIYTVTVTDDSDCSDVETVTVNGFGCPDITLELSGSDVSCFGLCNGSAQIELVAGGIPPYSYLWSTNATTSSIQNICAGNYSVTVTDSDGCIGTASVEISEPDILLTNASSTNESSENANDGTAWASPTGGTAPYSYQWSNSSTDSLITGLIPGTYIVTVTDANLCVALDTVVVNEFACPELTLIEAMWNINCSGICDAAIQIQQVINGTVPFTYQWSNGSTASLIESICPGMYSVTVTDSNDCTGFETYLIPKQPLLNANAGSTDETSQGANDGTAWAVPFGGIEPYSYEWSNGSTDSLITGLSPGIYSVTVTESGFFCSDSQSVVVNPFECSGVTESSIQNISCSDSCDGSITIIVSGGIGPFAYLWSTGDTTAGTIVNLCPGIYSVTIIDEGQNCSGFEEFELTLPIPPTSQIDEVTHITDSTASSISISVNGGFPPYFYAWSGPGGYTSSSEDLVNIEPGFYSVVISDFLGCLTTLDSIEIIDLRVGTGDIISQDIHVFPNPANDKVIVEFDDITDFEIQLINADGRVIKNWKNEKTLDISDSAAGFYMLNFTTRQGYFIQKFVIAR